MKYVYYIVDSAIFNNDEDMFKALVKGATIVNDDADLKFTITRINDETWLVATDKFTGKSVQSTISLFRPDVVAGMMDRLVEARLNNPDFFDLF